MVNFTARKSRKSKIGTDSIINPVLSKTRKNQTGQNNFKKHFKVTVSYYSQRLECLVWHLFFVLLGLGYIYLIASRPKLNILWASNFNNLSKSDIRLFVLSIVLMAVIILISEIYFTVYVGSPIASTGSFFAIILLLVISSLVRHIDVLPIYQTVFGWFS